MTTKKGTRINKFLSEIGYCSRRHADRLIDQGRVKVNGEIPLIGTKIFENDEIKVNGKLVYKDKKKNKARALLESVINTSPRSGNIVEDWEQINKAKALIKDYK